MAFRWSSLFERLRMPGGPKPNVSFVLLETEYQPLSDDILIQHAQTAYETAKPNGGIELLDSRTPASRVLRVENFFFAFHQAQQRYTGPPPGSTEVVRKAWSDHTCWTSLDWAGSELAEKDKPGARRIFVPLVSLLWRSNIAGLFFPDRGLTIPNVGEFPESIRWARRNGIPVQELFPQVSTKARQASAPGFN